MEKNTKNGRFFDGLISVATRFSADALGPVREVSISLAGSEVFSGYVGEAGDLLADRTADDLDPDVFPDEVSPYFGFANGSTFRGALALSAAAELLGLDFEDSDGSGRTLREYNALLRDRFAAAGGFIPESPASTRFDRSEPARGLDGFEAEDVAALIRSRTIALAELDGGPFYYYADGGRKPPASPPPASPPLDSAASRALPPTLAAERRAAAALRTALAAPGSLAGAAFAVILADYSAAVDANAPPSAGLGRPAFDAAEALTREAVDFVSSDDSDGLGEPEAFALLNDAARAYFDLDPDVFPGDPEADRYSLRLALADAARAFVAPAPEALSPALPDVLFAAAIALGEALAADAEGPPAAASPPLDSADSRALRAAGKTAEADALDASDAAADALDETRIDAEAARTAAADADAATDLRAYAAGALAAGDFDTAREAREKAAALDTAAGFWPEGEAVKEARAAADFSPDSADASRALAFAIASAQSAGGGVDSGSYASGAFAAFEVLSGSTPGDSVDFAVAVAREYRRAYPDAPASPPASPPPRAESFAATPDLAVGDADARAEAFRDSAPDALALASAAVDSAETVLIAARAAYEAARLALSAIPGG